MWRTFKKKKELIILIFLWVMGSINIGCCEIISSNFFRVAHNTSLGFLKNICPTVNIIEYTRFFSCGTIILFTAYIIYNSDKYI